MAATALNVAVTDCALVTSTVHVPVAGQPPPDHPVKVELASAAAVNITDVPELNEAVQIEPQLTPDGELLTLPVPVPAFVTVTGNVAATEVVKVTVTAVAAATATVQVLPDVLPHPVQLVNVDPVSGVAVRTTDVPDPTLNEQVVPQLMPAGELTTVPVPEPARVTVSGKLMLPPVPTSPSKRGQTAGHASAAESLSGLMQTYFPALSLNSPPAIFERQLALPLTRVMRKSWSK